MTTEQLSLYNEALDLLGERRLASLTENREPRRRLDGVWNENTKDYCLELGLWKFATRAVKLDHNSTITPEFGYTKVFARPSDFVRTVALCEDENFDSPLTRYSQEGGIFYADLSPIYLKYVSKDSSYGYNLSLWPQTFVRLVACYMAKRVCKALTQSGSNEDSLEIEFKKLLADAKSKSAFEESTKFLPLGGWSSARMGQGNIERGNRNRLIG